MRLQRMFVKHEISQIPLNAFANFILNIPIANFVPTDASKHACCGQEENQHQNEVNHEVSKTDVWI
jgi:hypothetical protein